MHKGKAVITRQQNGPQLRDSSRQAYTMSDALSSSHNYEQKGHLGWLQNRTVYRSNSYLEES